MPEVSGMLTVTRLESLGIGIKMELQTFLGNCDKSTIYTRLGMYETLSAQSDVILRACCKELCTSDPDTCNSVPGLCFKLYILASAKYRRKLEEMENVI